MAEYKKSKYEPGFLKVCWLNIVLELLLQLYFLFVIMQIVTSKL